MDQMWNSWVIFAALRRVGMEDLQACPIHLYFPCALQHHGPLEFKCSGPRIDQEYPSGAGGIPPNTVCDFAFIIPKGHGSGRA